MAKANDNNGNDSARFRVAGVLEVLSAFSEAQPPAGAAVAVATAAAAKEKIPRAQQRPRRRRQQQLDSGRTATTTKPTTMATSQEPREPPTPVPRITVPTPVTLPPRQSPPLLRPHASPHEPRQQQQQCHHHHDHPGASPPYSSPATSLGLSPSPEGDAWIDPAAAAASLARRETATGRSTAVRTARTSPPPSVPPSPAPKPAPAPAPALPAATAAVNEAWDPPLGAGGVGSGSGLGFSLGEDDVSGQGRRSRGSATTGDPGGRPSRFSANAREGGIEEVMRKLRQPSSVEARGQETAAAAGVGFPRQGMEGRAEAAGAAEGQGHRGGGVSSMRRSRRTTVAAKAAAEVVRGGDNDGLPEWMPRARQQSWSTDDDERGERSRSNSSGSSSSGERRGTGGGRFSLVSIVAGDIVRAQREEATRRRREKKAAAEAAEAAEAAAAAAAARATREEQREKDILLAASEDAVAEAVRAAARVVAAEEAAVTAAEAVRGGSTTATTGRTSPSGGMEAVKDAIVAWDERRAAGADGAGPEPEGVGGWKDRPDLWDSLLQSGPTLSPTRRQQLQRPSSPAAPPTEGNSGDEGGRETEEPPVPENGNAACGASVDAGGGDGGVRRRRLAPAELQAHLLNELRLHDDLQDAELQADGLMAAQRVEEARQEARVAGLLLRRERVRADSFFACASPWLVSFTLLDSCTGLVRLLNGNGFVCSPKSDASSRRDLFEDLTHVEETPGCLSHLGRLCACIHTILRYALADDVWNTRRTEEVDDI